jgi:hypothetical protein
MSLFGHSAPRGLTTAGREIRAGATPFLHAESFRCCLVVAADVGGRRRNVVGNLGSNIVPTLYFALELNSETVIREDV